ncbi:MAG: hypothetical protein ACR2MX_12545 [Cyclobacteriaceae bacterium]
MKLVNRLFKRNLTTTVCANCWGRQEYGNVYKPATFHAQIEVNNGNKKHSFIKAFVHQYVTPCRSSGKNF